MEFDSQASEPVKVEVVNFESMGDYMTKIVISTVVGIVVTSVAQSFATAYAEKRRAKKKAKVEQQLSAVK